MGISCRSLPMDMFAPLFTVIIAEKQKLDGG